MIRGSPRNPKYDGLVDMATKAAPLKYIPSGWCTDTMISTVTAPYIPATSQITATVRSELHVIGVLSTDRTALNHDGFATDRRSRANTLYSLVNQSLATLPDAPMHSLVADSIPYRVASHSLPSRQADRPSMPRSPRIVPSEPIPPRRSGSRTIARQRT